MDALNLYLYHALAAGFDPNPMPLQFALLVSALSGWVGFALLAWATWRHPSEIVHVLAALAIAGLVSVLAKAIAEALGYPRPFMLGLSPLHTPHAERAGLPSTHASVMFTVAFLCLARTPLRNFGWALTAVAGLTAWSRVHLGLHFPVDIAAGVVLAALVTATVLGAERLAAYIRARGARSTSRQALRWSQDGLSGKRFSLYLCLATTLVAIAIGAGTPSIFPLSFLLEDGPVESGTIFLYIAAALTVLLIRLPSLSRTDKIAICIVLLAFAAREADLHRAMFDESILKARFYSRDASLGQIALALLALAPIAAAGVWLLVRFGRRWSQSPARWTTPMATVAMFVVALVIAKAMDRLPDVLASSGMLEGVPSAARMLLLSIEEILELLLPVLAILAVAQARSAYRLETTGTSAKAPDRSGSEA